MKRSRLQFEPCSRPGALTVELLVAGALLATVMSMILPFMAQIAKVNNEISNREIALRAVRDVITTLQLDPQTDPAIPEHVNALLTNAELSVTSNTSDNAHAVSVTVSMTWENQIGSRSKPVALTYWRTNERGES